MGRDPNADVEVPTQQRLHQLRQGVHRDARLKDGHHGEGDGVESAGLFVEAKFQVFGHRSSFRAVIERHHEDADEDHGRHGAEPIELAGHHAVLGAAGAHADDFVRSKIGGNECQRRDPRGDGTARQEEIGAGFRVSLKREPDAQDEHDIHRQHDIIDRAETNRIHNNSSG